MRISSQDLDSTHSTENTLIRVKNNLLFSSDHARISLLVLLYFRAAFDTIDPCILLNRQENFVGIRGMVQIVFW